MKLTLNAAQAFLYRGLLKAEKARQLPKGWDAQDVMRLMIEMGGLFCIYLDGDERFRSEKLPGLLADERIKPLRQFVAMMWRMGRVE